MLSKNLPADSIHSVFLHSDVHYLGQYANDLCRTNLSTIKYNISISLVPLLILTIGLFLQGQIWIFFQLLGVFLHFLKNYPYLFFNGKLYRYFCKNRYSSLLFCLILTSRAIPGVGEYQHIFNLVGEYKL